MRTARLHKPAVVVLGALLAAAWVGTSNAQLIFSKKEIEREAKTQWLLLKRNTPMYPDERVQRYVRCVTDQVVSVLDPEWQDLNWEVVVVDEDQLNAHVLPGGKVVVNSGILRVASTQDALAAVIGHEIAHMTQNHVIERARAASGSEALGIIGQAATGVSFDTFQFGAALGFTLPYARAQESEADRVGLEYMSKAGFDPRAALQLWKNMRTEDEKLDPHNRPASFVSTHPTSQQRLDDMVPLLVEDLPLYNEARAEGHRPNCYAPSAN